MSYISVPWKYFQVAFRVMEEVPSWQPQWMNWSKSVIVTLDPPRAPPYLSGEVEKMHEFFLLSWLVECVCWHLVWVLSDFVGAVKKCPLQLKFCRYEYLKHPLMLVFCKLAMLLKACHFNFLVSIVLLYDETKTCCKSCSGFSNMSPILKVWNWFEKYLQVRMSLLW